MRCKMEYDKEEWKSKYNIKENLEYQEEEKNTQANEEKLDEEKLE